MTTTTLGYEGIVVEQKVNTVRSRVGKYVLRFRRPIVIVAHFVLLVSAFWGAANLRFEFEVPDTYRDLLLVGLGLTVTLRMLTFAGFGLYHGWWRHAGVDDLLRIGKAVTLGSLLLVAALFGLGLLPSFPRSILLLDWLLAFLLVGGARLGTRVAREETISRRRATDGTPTLILGAGVAAERMAPRIEDVASSTTTGAP